MNSYIHYATKVLSSEGRPLHYKDLTARALELGLKSSGATPWATMNAILAVDIKQNGEQSIFYRSAPGYFGLRVSAITPRKKDISQLPTRKPDPPAPKGTISKDLNTKQKGDIAEARVAELITVYGDSGLTCYRPVSDDEGIDILVKKRGEAEVAYIQVKSTFGYKTSGFVSTVKEKNIINKRRMLLVFVYFDLIEGDIHEHLFCIPAPEFLRLTRNDKKQPGVRVFTVGLNKPDQSKYAPFLIEKRELANKILEVLNET